MGRRKLHRTKEELLELQRARARRYHSKHKNRLNGERMDRYWKNKKVGKKMPNVRKN